ncbi:Fic family protein [Candidatus Gracilibacteria bacterium]|nr:Fic family protein [Candidatus Gracilibacteria bacterium]
MGATFKHYDLELLNPDFGSELTDLIIDLDYLRKKTLGGTTKPKIFFQLKSIFHILESIGSARLEGNRTTVAEYIEKKIERAQRIDEKDIEISNIEKAMGFIDKQIKTTPINRAFIADLHKQIVINLTPPPKGEGSRYPGEYRKVNLEITASQHLPPDFTQVNDYMDDLMKFINNGDSSKYDLLKTAIAHHRFSWIHPFDNGNGRTVRLLTYSMLVKQGFNVDVGRILNPTAIFCIDRDKYTEALALADTGTREGVLKWCKYVLSGLKHEIEKIDKLLDYNFLKSQILLPSISFALERKVITELESKILEVAIDKQTFRSSDIAQFMPGKVYTQRSRVLRELKNKKMISPIRDNSKQYTLRFDNNYLLRGIIKMLEKEGFIVIKD